ncbi:hypothetical protein [Lactobacillus sp. UCMA15818]|uniref:hypothetical protein n=1 Tax=Lactobacillus sp. UCMA15818 TaxID=2583394 RepID=UPI0025B21C7E|nr:hypothetical protein [Lactobacillus sp. UCMA15818]MDN2453158.1 hypothetical protein [Lactobacillus sp. UCMA15818]
MIDKKIKIDSNEFACAVVAGSGFKDDGDLEISKKALIRYLTAYYLIEKFNRLEASQFNFTKKPNFEYLMKALDQIKPV